MREREKVPCPHCGASIRKDASACPECGSDERTGWSEDTYLDGIDLPNDSEYDELLAKEFGSKERKSKSGKQWRTVVAGIVLVLLVLVLSPVC